MPQIRVIVANSIFGVVTTVLQRSKSIYSCESGGGFSILECVVRILQHVTHCTTELGLYPDWKKIRIDPEEKNTGAIISCFHPA